MVSGRVGPVLWEGRGKLCLRVLGPGHGVLVLRDLWGVIDHAMATAAVSAPSPCQDTPGPAVGISLPDGQPEAGLACAYPRVCPEWGDAG